MSGKNFGAARVGTPIMNFIAMKSHFFMVLGSMPCEATVLHDLLFTDLTVAVTDFSAVALDCDLRLASLNLNLGLL